MKYLCTNCSYVFDEAIWDNWEEIPAWTKIEQLEYCPVCEEYDTFHHINEEVTYLDENTRDYIDFEHNIELIHDDFRFEITIWNNSHPMWEDHRIAWIWLFDEYADLVEEKFLDTDSDTVVVFDDYDMDEFEIRIKCTQHNTFWKKFQL